MSKGLGRLFQIFSFCSLKADPSFPFFSVTNGLHSVVNPLYLDPRRRPLIVDVDNDMPPSSRVLLSWVDVMKGFSSLRKEF